MGRSRQRKLEERRQRGAVPAALPPAPEPRSPEAAAPDPTRLEHHRKGFGLLPAADDPQPGVATWILAAGKGLPRTCCSCPSSPCRHLRELRRAIDAHARSVGGDAETAFEASLWHRLAQCLIGRHPVALDRIAVRREAAGVSIKETGGATLARIAEHGSPGAQRLLERLAVGEQAKSPRAQLRLRLTKMQETPTEWLMNQRGVETIGQRREQSFWHRLAYHGFREAGSGGGFSLAVEPATGTVSLGFAPDGTGEVLRLELPRAAVPEVVATLAAAFPDRADLQVGAIEARWVHVLTLAVGGARVAVHPFLEVVAGEPVRIPMAELGRFVYGPLAYLPRFGGFVRLPGHGDGLPEDREESRASLPDVIDGIARSFGDDSLEVESALGPGRVFRRPDRIDLEPAGRDWHFLALRYRFGRGSLDLRELWAARSRRQRYLATSDGWVDLEAEENGSQVGGAVGGDGLAPGDLRLEPLDLLRLQARSGGILHAVGAGPEAERLRALLELRPARPYRPPVGLRSVLRDYQERGVEWLLFLRDNRLSGLLCDDMGLGKTHQALALLLWLREEGDLRPSLVVCPTTVLSHWRDKVAGHAPELRVAIHQGPERSLAAALAGADLVLTSYGVLRRDADELAAVPFAALILDEVQHLKNRATQGHEAARRLQAGLRLGMTGTPVENSVKDLKAIFDLVLPGYLGGDEAFARRYAAVEGSALAPERLAELGRLTAPFILRRTKAAVLAELPEKIEDRRSCPLSDEQAALYREALRGRGADLVRSLADRDSPVPYVHVFALIDLLKQVCDHPALALKRLAHWQEHASGKWDLFCELLDESLAGGEKVVVFSQYLGMLELMSRHLDGLGVGHVRLTGASRDRGALIHRFADEPDCRVFLASLLAGGTGIDLVAASVVIHYDRWWNAAREDQATDRVHRIGQHRSVQVFKLVTEGTLEERIDAIVARKRALMAAVVHEDDPGLSKALGRDELLEMLRPL